MKLSDVKGERTIDVIADLIEPVSNIVSDEEIKKAFKRGKVPKGETARGYAAKRMKSAVPLMLKRHKTDVIAILATIEGTTPEKYAEELNLAKAMADFAGLVTDQDFLALLSSFLPTQASSTSASETTQE